MVLSAQTIRRLNIITPCKLAWKDSRGCSAGLTSAGYDLTLGGDREIIVYPLHIKYLFREMMFDCVPIVLRRFFKESPRSSFVLAAASEYFNVPCNVRGVVHDKSSLARKGMAVQNTVLEPGWRGYVTLELSNHGRGLLRFKPGDALAQVSFDLLDEPTELPYQGKYQDQGPEPQQAL